jgi:hypothetical protein
LNEVFYAFSIRQVSLALLRKIGDLIKAAIGDNKFMEAILALKKAKLFLLASTIPAR